MKTLEQYNKEFEERRATLERLKHFTDIACPHCKNVEMKYTNYNIVLLSNPPQKEIFCPECNYRTTIFVD